MHSQQIRQRRRRVTRESTQSGEPTTKTQAPPQNREEPRRPASGRYTQHAKRSRQFKTTDLIPKRIWSVLAVVALLLAAIAGLNLLHLNSPDWIELIGPEGVASLSLESGRGLGIWYSNFLLLLTSCVSLQLYLLRKHRRDDYRGSYRIWMWLALIFLIASAASVTGISAMVRNLFSNTIGTSDFGSALFWLLVIKLVGLTLLIVRGLIEVRFSRLAVLGLVVVLLGYGTAILLNELPQFQAQSTKYVHAALGNCLLVGCTALLLSVLGFARFVYLDANGLIKSSVNTSQSGVRSSKEEKRVKRAAKKAAATQEKAETKQAKLDANEARMDEKELKREQRLAEKREKVAEDSRKSETSSGKKSKTAEVPVAKNTGKTQKSQRKSSENAAASNKSARQKKTTVAATPKTNTKTKTSTNPGGQKPAQNRKSSVGQLTGDEYLMSLDDNDMENLSKAERRRFKKLKRRSINRAA